MPLSSSSSAICVCELLAYVHAVNNAPATKNKTANKITAKAASTITNTRFVTLCLTYCLLCALVCTFSRSIPRQILISATETRTHSWHISMKLISETDFIRNWSVATHHLATSLMLKKSHMMLRELSLDDPFV